MDDGDAEGLGAALDTRISQLRDLLKEVNAIFCDRQAQRQARCDERAACRAEITKVNTSRWGEVVNLDWLHEKCYVEHARQETAKYPELFPDQVLSWVERQPLW